MENKEKIQIEEKQVDVYLQNEKRRVQMVMILLTLSVLLIAMLISVMVEQAILSRLWVYKSEPTSSVLEVSNDDGNIDSRAGEQTDNFNKNVKKCEKLKSELLKGLSKYPIQINSNDLCVPQIVNFSLLKIKSETFVHALEKYDVYVSTTTACSSLEESVVLKTISNGNKDVSTTSIRVSLSHLTSMDDIHEFLNIFDKVWNELLLK